MALTPYEIPLTPEAQRFSIDLAGVTYYMSVYWNSFCACWILDIADSDNNPLVQGLPLVTGMDMVTQLQDLELGGALIVMTDSNPDALPTYANLGDASHLYFVTGP